MSEIMNESGVINRSDRAPIALFTYNRPEHTRETIRALQANYLAEESDLFVFSDAPKSSAGLPAVQDVRNYLKTIDGFKSIRIIERPTNFGLAKSIIEGVSDICRQYGKVIVLEDDLVTSPYFLQFMNDALRVYESDKNVASIHGYVYPITDLPQTFFMRGTDCWGWATWGDRWAMFEADGATLLEQLKRRNLTKQFDFNGAYPFTRMLVEQINGQNNSWAIRWHASAFLKEKFTLYPGKSLVLNIGNDGSGAHCGVTDRFSSEVSMSAIKIVPIPVEESSCAFQMFERYFRKQKGGLFARVGRIVTGIARKFN